MDIRIKSGQNPEVKFLKSELKSVETVLGICASIGTHLDDAELESAAATLAGCLKKYLPKKEAEAQQ